MKYFFQSISWNAYFTIISLCKLPRNFMIYFLKAFMKYEKSENWFSEFSLLLKTFLLNLFSCLTNSFNVNGVFKNLKEKVNIKWFFVFEWWMKRILILMQLQDFNRIKRRGGRKNCFWFCLSKKITGIWKSSHRELFCKKGVLRCVLTRNLRCSG